MRRTVATLATEHPDRPWLGVNFWSRVGGPRMWPRYDAQTVAKELQVLADHGLNLTRSFFFWPDFMPTPYSIDEVLLDRYADFLDQHRALGLSTIPTLIVGHMSGQNWDPAWRDGRDVYGDVWLVGRQAWFAEQVARRFAGHPAVAGWLLSNEMPIYGGPGNRETVPAWAALVIAGLRAGGARQPVSIGDGAWTIEAGAEPGWGPTGGWTLRDLGPLVDWVGPHVYPMGNDQVRQHLRAACVCEMVACAGKPVVLEEFGASSDFVSDENLGHYYRQVLHTSLLAGATGWIAWNNTDFDDLVDEEPYSHHPFELHFGVTTNEGTPKAPLRELAAFRQVLDRVDLARCERAPSEVGLVIGSHLDTEYPFTVPEDRRVGVAAAEQAYIACREAGLPPVLVRESHGGISEGCRLYLLPSTKAITGPAARRLTELATAGATVYLSYSPGGAEVQRGPWYPGVDRLLGVRHRLRYGLADRIDGQTVDLELVRDLGGLPAGTRLSFATGSNPNLHAFLPVDPVDAEVLATDSAGRPALLRRPVGTGAFVYCTYPLESMAAFTAHVNPDQTWRLYRALAREAGVTPLVRVDEPHLLVDCLDRDDGTRFVWLVSQSSAPLTVTPECADGALLRDLETGEEVSELELPPFGVRVLNTCMSQLPPDGENMASSKT